MKSFPGKTIFNRAAGVLSVILLLEIFPSCAKRPEQSKPQEAKPQEAVESATPFPLLLELVYEISRSPFESPVLPQKSAGPLNGYILETSSGKPVLYPATGEEAPADAGKLFIGFHVINQALPHSTSFLHLERSAVDRAKFHTQETPGIPALLSNLGPFAVLVQPATVGVSVDPSGINLEAAGKTWKLRPGESATLVESSEELTGGNLFEKYAEARKAQGLPQQETSDKYIQEDLSTFFPADSPSKFYLRLSAHFHGPVQVSAFDVLAEWNRAQQKLSEGPYEEALQALENVLTAAPYHAEALRLWSRAKQLAESGKNPAAIKCLLVFPAGAPTEKQKTLWEKFHEGIATLGLPEGDPDRALANSAVQDGSFTLAAPSGTYRLRVLVPGFLPFEQMLELKDKQEIEIALQAA